MATENLLNLKVHKVSKPTYEDLEKNNKLDSTAIYLTPDEGYVTAGQKVGSTLGERATAEGYNTTASRPYSHAEGEETLASGHQSHAEGYRTAATGEISHAEGFGSTASGNSSHAEGASTAEGVHSHSEGYNTTAVGEGSHAEGNSSGSLDEATGGNLSSGLGADARDIISAWATEGNQLFAMAVGNYSHTEGTDCLAIGESAHSEGNNTTAIGEMSHSEGCKTGAYGIASHAEGVGDTFYPAVLTGSADSVTLENTWKTGVGDQGYSFSLAYGRGSHTEGLNCLALGDYSHAEGIGTFAAEGAHAEGGYIGDGDGDGDGYYYEKGGQAKGPGSHAEGVSTTASKAGSHAEGVHTTADGWTSHAEGWYTNAKHEASHAGGSHTQTSRNNQTVVGEYNADNSGALFIVGNGSSSKRSNAFEVKKDGTAHTAAGELENKGKLTIDGQVYELQVATDSSSAGSGKITFII